MFKIKIERSKSNSDIAKERMKKILYKDRIKLAPDDMSNLTKDIKKVLCKYIDADINSSSISFEDIAGESVMRADFAVKQLRRNNK